MADFATAPSRRTLLQTLALVPVAASTLPINPLRQDALTSLHRRYGDEPPTLARTKEGRSMSRFRYIKAEHYCMIIDAGFFAEPRFVRETLHQAGFVTQQALCSYLLDMGFTDAWNARHIKQDIAKALAYANALGLGHDCPDMARLAVTLSPFWKWGYHYDDWEEQPDKGGFTADRIQPLVRGLVDHVHDVTGHPRPRGWLRERRERLS